MANLHNLKIQPHYFTFSSSKTIPINSDKPY